MKFLGEVLEDQAKKDGILHLQTYLAKKTNTSRSAVNESIKKLKLSTDNIKMFRKYMKAMGHDIKVSVEVLGKKGDTE